MTYLYTIKKGKALDYRYTDEADCKEQAHKRIDQYKKDWMEASAEGLYEADSSCCLKRVQDVSMSGSCFFRCHNSRT